MNSKRKGARGEVELAHVLQGYGYNTRRGQQYCGVNGDADVVGLPGCHIEAKRVQALNIDMAMQQAIRDARAGEMPVVMHRKNDDHKKGSMKGKWKVTMLLDDFMKLYGEKADERGNEDAKKEGTIIEEDQI